MIRFDAVTKHYRGAPRAALDSVNLEIGAGEFVFLVGASGSGKSSLLRLMLREERPSKGEIHVLGQRLTTISTRKVPYFRRSLGVVFQDFRLLPNKTVHDNVAFTLQVIGKSRGFIQTTVPDVLETVGLAEKAQNYPNELSGGEQQRVAIARAVVNKPAILLADEPTGNLDPTTSDGIMAVLERINRAGTTVVMATHDVTIVDRLQKRVVELVGGRIIRDELEASYVTSSIPLPRRAEAQAAPQPGPEVPLWARRGGQADEALQPAAPEPAARSAEERRPAAVPMTAATDALARWSSRPVPETPPRHDGPAEPSRFGAAEQTGSVRTGPTPAAAGWSDATPAADSTTAGSTLTGSVEAGPPRAAQWDAGQAVAAADGQAGPPPAAPRPAEHEATGPTGTVPTRPGATGPVRPATGPTPVTAEAPPIWFRSDTGPVLVPGEHAPWRAAPVAPPAGPPDSGDSRALFFAAPVPAPVPAQRGWTPEAEPDDQPAEPVQAAPAPPPVPAFAAPESPPIATPSPVTRTAASPADMDDTGDPEGQLRRLGRHRTQPLPDHLDFVTGLGLRAARSDDEVGPSS